MGLSASQARLLMIVSRMNDVSLKMSQISQAQTELAVQSEIVAKNYNDAMSDTKLVMDIATEEDSYTTTTVDATYKNLTGQGYLAVTQRDEILLEKDENGKWIIPTDLEGNPLIEIDETTGKARIINDEEGKEYNIKDGSEYLQDSAAINNALSYGALYLIDTNNLANGKITMGNISTSGHLRSVYDTSNDAEAQSTKEYETARISRLDNQYDQDMKACETEMTALTKEYDTIREYIKGNVDRTFDYNKG